MLQLTDRFSKAWKLLWIVPTILISQLGCSQPVVSFDDDTESVTVKAIAVMGNDLKGKTVKVNGCRMRQVDNYNVERLPGVFIREEGFSTVYNKNEAAKWIGFLVEDSEHESLSAFARKEKFGEILLKLKRDDGLALKGELVELPGLGKYGLICSEIKTAE